MVQTSVAQTSDAPASVAQTSDAPTSVAQTSVAPTSANKILQVVEDTPNSSPKQNQTLQPVYIIYDTDEEAQEDANQPAAQVTDGYCTICKRTFKNLKGLTSHSRVHKKK